ncbi:hypothetical protein LJ657_09905 [Streptomyces sp. NR30]|uniref:Uncharacterized protein n=1 Tax=Streptomyces guryensis TaxID=2886947 RepID=A0A9Q3VME7_9ACTN|nr:hypothetical protein [Streptomyces guryensis]
MGGRTGQRVPVERRREPRHGTRRQRHALHGHGGPHRPPPRHGGPGLGRLARRAAVAHAGRPARLPPARRRGRDVRPADGHGQARPDPLREQAGRPGPPGRPPPGPPPPAPPGPAAGPRQFPHPAEPLTGPRCQCRVVRWIPCGPFPTSNARWRPSRSSAPTSPAATSRRPSPSSPGASRQARRMSSCSARPAPASPPPPRG